MKECKRLAQKGDMRGARMVANQVASYRRIHDRNLQASIQIGTQAQSMVSDHKVNRGQVESIKGFTFANTYESFGRLEAREQRSAFRMSAINHMESSMRESMDEAYTTNGYSNASEDGYISSGADNGQAGRLQELELQTIMNQAIGKEKNRLYFPSADSLQSEDIEAPFILNLKSLDKPQFGTSITLNPIVGTPNISDPIFDISSCTVDMIKRRIIQDTYAAGQLNLFAKNGSYVRPFEIGKFHSAEAYFERLEFDSTIESAQINNGDFLFIRIVREEDTKAAEDERIVRERIERINDGLKQ